jgi:hypothetical protein
MLSRRDLLVGVAGPLARHAHDGDRAATARPDIVQFDVPSGACDCHTHIFGDARQFRDGGTRLHAGAGVDRGAPLHRALHWTVS